MWSRGLMSIVLLSLISGGISQKLSIFPIEPPEFPEDTCNVPIPLESLPQPKFDYALIVPFKLTSGSEATMCVWAKSEVAATIKVDWEYSLEQTNIIVFDIDANSETYKCTSFPVPEVQKPEAYFLTFSATGEGIDKADRKSVVIDRPRTACFAQKDKPKHHKGETVNMRFLCIDEHLKQVVKKFSKLIVSDPYGNRIYQILNPPIEHGVLTFSFDTSEHLRDGYYSVETEDENGNTDYTSFEIETYDLPRIKFNTQCPNTIAVLDKYGHITGHAEYQFGKPVQGSVSGNCCRRVPKYGREANCFRGVPDICHEFTTELDENGDFDEALDMGVFKLPFSGYEDSILCDMTLKEAGTGALNPTSCYMSITNRLALLTMDHKMSRYYNKVSLLFSARLTDEKDNPLVQRTITVSIDGQNVKCLTTDENGQAECELDTSSYHKENITVQASYQDEKLCYGREKYYYNQYDPGYPSDEVMLFRYYTHSGSQVRLRPLSGKLDCNQDYSMQVDYLFTKHGVGHGATSASIKYFMISRGNIVAHGELSVDLSESYSGSTTIHFFTDANFASGAEVMVFVPLETDVISDTARLDINECFKNNVTLEFTEDVVQPGSTVHQKVTGAPGSFCGFRVIDAAFNSLGFYEEFTPYNVYSRMQTYLYRYEYGGIKYEDPEPPCIDTNTVYFCQGLHMKPATSKSDGETMQNFQDFHVLLFTNLDTRRPKACGEEYEPSYPTPYFRGGPNAKFAAFAESDIGGPPRVETFRNDFSDLFGFGVTFLDPLGISIVDLDIPDRLTIWESTGFCASPEEGIGLTIKPAQVKTFQIFFADFFCPLYVTRGEVVNVPIQVSNYADNCATVTVEIEESEHYVVESWDITSEQCICHQTTSTWTAKIIFSEKGPVDLTIRASTNKISETCDGSHDDNESQRTDTVVKTVTVKLEGINEEDTFSHLASVSDTTDNVAVQVVEPENLVMDSFQFFFSVMGDPLSLSIKNFDNLLSTPTFSCSQVHTFIKTIIAFSKYLKALGRLDEEQSKKLHSRLVLGYMDLLSCRDYSGAFGLYFNSFSHNTWLTLSSIHAIHNLKEFIYTDENIVPNGLIFLSQKQDLQSGCIMPDGLPITYQGNYDIVMHLNAFAASILVELSPHYSNAGPLLIGVTKCISTVDFDSQDTLTQAYLLDAKASLEEYDLWQIYYDSLKAKAITTGGSLYWTSDNSVPLLTRHFFPRETGDISITATILISITKQPNPNQELQNSKALIAKWLSAQLNRRGACYASQDTNVAIEALSLFGLSVHNGDTDAQVSVLHNGAEVFNIHVTEENKFVVFSEELNSGYGDYEIIVNGNCNCLVQITTSYNKKIDTGADSAFALSAVATPYECIGGVGKQISVELSFRYIGNRNQSSNCVVRFEMLTGYVIDYSNAPRDLYPPIVEENTALFFLDYVTSEETKFTVSLYLQNSVSNFQSASVVIQDVVTDETGAAEYFYPCQEALEQ